MKINYKYLIGFIILLIVEIYIGMFIHDKVIRPFIGDVLVVGVIYFFIRGIFRKAKYLVWGVFIFACAVEVGQYFNLASILHMEHIKLAKIILGSTFDWNDILCYFIGTIMLLLYEIIEDKKQNRNFKG